MYVLAQNVVVSQSMDSIRLTSSLVGSVVEIAEPYLVEMHQILEQGSKEVATELELFLFKHRLLVPTSIANSDLQQLLNILNEKLVLTMMPTEACNFNCTYCYEAHNSPVMTPNMIQHIQNFLLSQLKNEEIKYVQINWFGGEPTLCPELVLNFNHFVQNLKEQYDFTFFSEMTTNGYLLNVPLFEKMFLCGVRDYQITLDGWLHDTYRPHVSGKATLDTILKNLNEISCLPRDKYMFTIRIRYNVSQNNNDLSWYDHLKQLFGHDDRFVVYMNLVGDWGGTSVKAMDIYSNKEASDIRMQHVNYMNFIGLQNSNTEMHEFATLKNTCYAAYQKSFVFRPNGDIVKCTVALNAEENKIGYIDEINGVCINESQNALWSETDIQGCKKCVALLSCLNKRCPKKRIIDNSRQGSCLMQKNIENGVALL